MAIIGGGTALTYQPAADYCNESGGGPDSFTYTLNGGSTATVSITVTCVEEAQPPGGGGTGTGSTNTTIVPEPRDLKHPGDQHHPRGGSGLGRRHPRIAVKGNYAFFTLTCRLKDKDCSGTVTISASIPAIALGPTMEKVILVKGRFRIGPGRSVLVRAKLTKKGLEVLEAKRSLRGVAALMAIVDATNGERGQIEVNLVRRPKASLLGSGK